jgi:hypothetical protein
MGLFKREISKREARKLIKQAKFCIYAVSGSEELKFWLIPKDGYVLVVEESGSSYWLDEWSEGFVASFGRDRKGLLLCIKSGRVGYEEGLWFGIL